MFRHHNAPHRHGGRLRRSRRLDLILAAVAHYRGSHTMNLEVDHHEFALLRAGLDRLIHDSAHALAPADRDKARALYARLETLSAPKVTP